MNTNLITVEDQAAALLCRLAAARLEMDEVKIRAAAGLPRTIKLHHARHTLATLCDECGCTEALKADILGHSKKTQSQKYTHGRISAMRDVLQRVEDRLLGDVVLEEKTGT